MSNEPRISIATADEVEAIGAIADPILDLLMALPGQTGLHAFCYLGTTMMMNVETGMSKVEAWDHVAASIRRSIAKNVKRGLS